VIALGPPPEPSSSDPILDSEAQIVRRPGGRSARVVEQVLEAAGQELARTGYVALSIERVAERAGVNKTTIYRRWPTKRDLVASLIQSLGGDPPHAPETGHIASDLLALARATRNRMLEYHRGGLARALLAQADHPEVTELSATLREQLREPWRKALRAAVARGELSIETDIALVLEVIISAIANRVGRREQAPDDSFLESLITLVLDGARTKRSD
jgi:AcrR family transcriptional regulator